MTQLWHSAIAKRVRAFIAVVLSAGSLAAERVWEPTDKAKSSRGEYEGVGDGKVLERVHSRVSGAA